LNATSKLHCCIYFENLLICNSYNILTKKLKKGLTKSYLCDIILKLQIGNPFCMLAAPVAQ
ncbi:MAG: hypothetical protein ACI4RV_09270, partial [Eubacteriales bacterium]